MSIETPIPQEVARVVNEHVEHELRLIAQYENRKPLDESGINDLHRMAARIYSTGYEAGRRYEAALADGERQRQRDREAQS